MGLMSCHVAPGYLSSTTSGVDTIPQTFENPVGIPEIPKTSKDTIMLPPEKKDLAPEEKKNFSPDVALPKKGEQKKQIVGIDSADTQKTPLKLPEASTFIKNADWVMTHEGKKIGTPCNLYVMRVLEVSGFPQDFFLANNFDRYARKYFRYAQITEFKNDRSGSDIARLKQHLWSFPERTPFIFQWNGIGMHGHIAIVERIQDQLIIYQASLDKYTARKDQTTVQTLLNGFNRRVLTVYANFSRPSK